MTEADVPSGTEEYALKRAVRKVCDGGEHFPARFLAGMLDK